MPNNDDINRLVDSDDQYPDNDPELETSDPEDLEEEPEPENDPKPDEKSEGDSEEPEPQVNPYEQRFTERGLDRQFKSVDDMIDRVPYMNKWATQLAQENAELKKRIGDAGQKTVTEQQEHYDPDEFYANPTKMLDGRYANRDDIATMQARVQGLEQEIRMRMDIEDFKRGHSDFDQYEPMMAEILKADPQIASLKDPISILYTMAKSATAPVVDNVTEKTRQAVQDKTNIAKQNARTEGSGNKPKSRKVSRDDLYNMPLDDLGKMLGFVPDD